ncbi:MAG: pyridoxamine 5'-phosphate oxidase family protein [Chthoniobacterales bacterium]
MPEHPANFGDLAFTPAVKATQERLGSRENYARREGRHSRTRLGPEEAAFIAVRDSLYLASVGENGWPYIQYRGGPRGFLKLLDQETLGFADFRGNRQYISTGNVLATGRTCLFLMDYPAQERLKIWADATLSEDPALLAQLANSSYAAKAERAFLFHVLAFDWNCQQHIVRRYTPEEYAAVSERELQKNNERTN